MFTRVKIVFIKRKLNRIYRQILNMYQYLLIGTYFTFPHPVYLQDRYNRFLLNDNCH
jgi:hypothetical protein